MKKSFKLEYTTLGKTESYIVIADNEQQANKIGITRAIKELKFLNRVIEVAPSPSHPVA